MNCDHAANFISARIDGELPGDDADTLALDAHLAECAACRATAEAMQLQDAALVRAFAGGRVAAEGVADRVLLEISPRRRTRRWVPLACGVAAGILLAWVTLGPQLPPEDPRLHQDAQRSNPVAAAQPVAQVSLSTGEVFACPSHAPDAWQPVAAGAAVAQGGRVRTGPAARVELQLADGSQVRLNGGSEACFAGSRVVELKRGQLWSAVPQDSPALCVQIPAEGGGVAAGEAVTAVTPPGGRVDFSCSGGGGVLTAVQGAAKVIDRRGTETQIPAGDSATIVFGSGALLNPTGDVLLATRWLNDLLVLKGRDDPELTARVNELLSRINAEAATRPTGAPAVPGPVEQHVRAEGHLWSTPIACYVQSQASQGDRGKRLTAARLLCDLATPSAIPDLVTLMGDQDGHVRLHVAKALHRLTGQTLGRSPDECATDAGAAIAQTQKKWQAWWEQNKARYPVHAG